MWQEIGGVIHAQGNSELVIEFFSEGEAAIGNDFAIDDIGLREILLPEFELVKTEDRTTAVVGDVVTYGLSVQNSCAQPLTNAVLRDFLPEGLTFVSGSVVINGVSQSTANPLIGFFVPDILGGTTLQVSFQAQVNAVPSENPAVNRAALQYVYTPIPNGIEDVYNTNSNPVSLLIQTALRVSAPLVLIAGKRERRAAMMAALLFPLPSSSQAGCYFCYRAVPSYGGKVWSAHTLNSHRKSTQCAQTTLANTKLAPPIARSNKRFYVPFYFWQAQPHRICPTRGAPP